jgi:predicted phosphohydrolase
MTKIVCISDTHETHWDLKIPDGDILIHTGDSTFMGDYSSIYDFNKWLGTLPHKHKIIISGNHDWMFERAPKKIKDTITNAIYLQDSEITLEGLRIYGSPHTPQFGNWAFMPLRGSQEIKDKWNLIPEGLDILMTHGPPHGILDVNPDNYHCGCDDLLEVVRKVKPKLHIFGHIHHAYGRYKTKDTMFVNAAICNEAYKPVNKPIILEL